MNLNKDLIQVYAKTLYDTLHEVGPEAQDKVLDNFMEILKERDHLFLFDSIVKEFEKITLPTGFTENKKVVEALNYQIYNHRDNIISEEEGKIVIKVDE